MDHWRRLRWLAPGLVAQHMANAQRRQEEFDRIKRAQELIGQKQRDTEARQQELERRLAALKTEVELMARGVLK